MCNISRYITIGVAALALLAVAGQVTADTVHSYTNVTMDPGHYLVAEGTFGAQVIATTGTPGDGLGGSTSYPLDDTWRWASTSVGNANAFDRYWLQICRDQGETATFDLGVAHDKVYIALNQDHGPYPQEALEYTVAVSNDNVSYSTLGWGTPITMYIKGWSAAGEDNMPASDGNGNGVLNDDYSALWTLPGYYRYVRLEGISYSSPYNQPEVDAVMGAHPIPAPSALVGLVSMAVAGLVIGFRRKLRKA
jgi:hypothetical protein